MGWTKKPNAAQYKGADWNNFVLRAHNCTPEQARRIAFINPEITFYFFCREYMVLEGPVYEKYGAFYPGDAVFFKGEPWLGSAPQCDTYIKNGTAVAYINPDNPKQFKQTGCYEMADGRAAVDVVCIFAGNYCTNEPPYLRAHNDPHAKQPFNDNIQKVLSDGSVKFLQDKGIVVLLTVLNGHTEVGWSEFTSKETAQGFVDYLKSDVIDRYGLDGIDIDDEYSAGTRQNDSLAMVTTLMKQTMPNKLLTKALFRDRQYFKASWKGHKLAQNLDYGWEMTYGGGGPDRRLKFYASHGMPKNTLCLGFSAGEDPGPSNVRHHMQEVMNEGYGGGMLFDFQKQPQSLDLMQVIVNTMAGDNNWHHDPDCG